MSEHTWPKGKKAYRMQVDTFGMPTVDMDVVVDFDRMTESEAKEHVHFWMDGAALVRDCKGSLLEAFLKKVCHFAISFAVLNDYNAHGVNEQFKEEEGWSLEDGVIEFTGLAVDWQPEYSDMDITEVTVAA